MRRTNALQNYLEFLTRVYDPEGIEHSVEWTKDSPHADIHGQYVAVNPNIRDWIGKSMSQENELRVLVDTVSHEVEHTVESKLDGKKEFMEQYPEAPQVAGAIYNIFEDVYIDFTRTNRWKGLRVSRAFFVSKVLSNHHRHPKLTNYESKTKAMMEGMLQVALSGTAKGITELDDEETKKFLGWIRKKVKEVRTMDTVEQREELIREVTQTLFDLADIEEASEFANEMEIPTGETVENSDIDPNEESAYDPDAGNPITDDGSDESTTDSQENETAEEDSEVSQQEDEEAQSTESEESEKTGEGTGSQEGEKQEGEQETDEPLDENEPLDSDNSRESITNDGDMMQTALPGLGDEDAPEPSDVRSDSSLDSVSESSEGEEGNPTDVPTPKSERDDAQQSGEVSSAYVGEEIEEMESLDDEGVASWFGVSSDSNIEEPSERFEEKVQELHNKTQRANTSLAEKKAKRDQHSDDFVSDHKSVLRTLKEKGLDDKIEEAFRELKNADKDIPVEHGEDIHLQNAIEYRAGDYSQTRVHKHNLPSEYGERAVAVALDLSGSMPEHTAKVALLGLQKACDEIGDQFTACGFKTFRNNGHKVVYTPLITGPREEFNPSHLSAVFSGGTTPMASGIQQANELLEESTRPEQVLIVITDGKPNVGLDGRGSSPEINEECRELVDNAKRNGVKVIGMGFGSVDERTMKTVFGNDGYVMGELDNLADRLLEVYRQQMKVVDEHDSYR